MVINVFVKEYHLNIFVIDALIDQIHNGNMDNANVMKVILYMVLNVYLILLMVEILNLIVELELISIFSRKNVYHAQMDV